MKSFSYYLTLFVIKLKGTKADFRRDPIDYVKLRNQDVHDPNHQRFRPNQINRFKIRESIVTEILPGKSCANHVIFCPGGAFVYGPVHHHWEAAKTIVNKTGCTLWMVNYPKAPEQKIDIISRNIDAIYDKAVEKYTGKNIILLGDSVGATLIIALIQRLISQKRALPKLLILISPVMDAELSNPEIAEIDKKDPILSKAGVLSAKRMAALNNNLKDARISPLHGNFENIPPTLLFLAENDITYPDQKLTLQRMADAQVPVKATIGKGMPHIWPLLPVIQEGKTALKGIVNAIQKISE